MEVTHAPRVHAEQRESVLEALLEHSKSGTASQDKARAPVRRDARRREATVLSTRGGRQPPGLLRALRPQRWRSCALLA